VPPRPLELQAPEAPFSPFAMPHQSREASGAGCKANCLWSAACSRAGPVEVALVLDILFVTLTLAFFALAWAYVLGCDQV
jgi:hypothetical protein